VPETADLTQARALLLADRYAEAIASLDAFLVGTRGDIATRDRVEGMTLRLVGLLNIGRTAELPGALDEAFEASRLAPDPARYGHLHALAAVVALGSRSLERCVTHLVRGARALNSVELTDATTAWAWHDLAIGYSVAGFHGQANATIDRARQVAANVGLPPVVFAAPEIRLRQAVSLDQRGDSDGCRRVLRALGTDFQARADAGEADTLRPSSIGAYGYAAARVATLHGRAVPGPVELDDAVRMMERSGEGTRVRDLRTLGAVCVAIARCRPVEAVARLETARVSDETLGAAEVHRLRALAHLVAGDHASAYGADRQAFRVATAQYDRLGELFVDSMAARLDHEALTRRVATYADAAMTDPLTALPNRRYLEQHVADMVARGEPAILGVCDLDRFATVNTAHGQISGDLVLQRFAGVLNRVMRRGDFVARYGGDEFVVVLPATSKAEVNEIARRINSAVAAEDWDALIPGTPVSVTIGWASIGTENGYRSVAEAFQAADRAIPRPRTSEQSERTEV
jgi:diguanylate cyclase (GGDEF)-like protein